MEMVAGQQEHAVFAPLEALLFAARPPDGGGAATLGDVYHFVERKPNGWQHGARRYLGNACLGDALLAFKLDEGGVADALFPATEVQGTQVGDVVAGMAGQSERVHAFVMGAFESA